MADHGVSLPPELARPTSGELAWRQRALDAERQLRAVTAQREILATVIRELLDGASPETIAAVRTAVDGCTGG